MAPRLFQSSEKSETFHVCLVGVANSAIRDAVKLMYGEQLTIQEKNVKRFSTFLKSIEIEVESQARNQQADPVIKNLQLSKPSPVPDDSRSVVENADEEEDTTKKEQTPSPSKEKTKKPKQTLVKKRKLSTEETETPRQSPSLSPSTSLQLIEETISSSSKTLRKEGLSSSSESVKITNRKGGLASLDNWTETSDDADLDDIDFKIVAGNI
jgi:hypothetical protein